ncbi:MAG: DUF535 family protein [Methylobacteriaceae bacterium]|nr:DUF535 family protein [Methylobacteriaceae bacterium]
MELAMRHGGPPQGSAQIYALSLWKCMTNGYLAKSLSRDEAVSCFLRNYEFLVKKVSCEGVLKLCSDDYVLWDNRRYHVTAKMEHGILDESENTLHFKEGWRAIYGTSFSFVPGHIFGSDEPDVILISRMQGRAGEGEKYLEATKSCGDITPQFVTYNVLLGLAKTLRIHSIIGVAAQNQVYYKEALSDIFIPTYD